MNKNTEVAPSDYEQWGLECLRKLCKDARAWKRAVYERKASGKGYC